MEIPDKLLLAMLRRLLEEDEDDETSDTPDMSARMDRLESALARSTGRLKVRTIGSNY